MPLIVNAVAHRKEDYGLRPEELALLWNMEERHFWHHARNRWIARALGAAGVAPPATVLEVGCGSGAVAGYLHGRGYRVTGLDTSAALVHKAHERYPEATFIVGDVAEVDAGSFDAIGLFDVLEHLDDPVAMLGACRRHARSGTLFASTVPAQRELHTVIDDLSGHKKRYETGELAALLASAGLVAVEERGIFRATLPIQRALRRGARDRQLRELSDDDRRTLWASNFRVPSPPVNLCLGALCALERMVGFGWAKNRPGASLLATGRVP